MAFRDTILSSSAVYLFGRVLEDLAVTVREENPGLRPVRGGDNRFLQKQLSEKNAKLARIYAFSYEGAFFELSRPTILLVHGEGEDPDSPQPGNAPGVDRLSRAPNDPDLTGIGSQIGSISTGMRVWIYDKGDFSLRLEPDTGPLEQILLAAELQSGDVRSATSGVMARSSGVMARSSGVMARSSGVMARSSGVMARRGDMD